MRKEFLSQCPEIIHEAETARAAGRYKLASFKVRRARINPREISHLENSQLTDLIRAWRIDVVANTSAAKRSWNGEKSVGHLRETQEVIKTYYDNPGVQGRVPQFSRDNEGNPYNFEVEMLRDRAKYCLAAAVITGDQSFVRVASEFFEEAIDLAEENELVGMEAGIVNGDFEQIAESYHVARSDEWEFLSNLDRARWMARTYFGESVKRLKFADCVIALSDLVKIRKNPLKIVQDLVIGVVRSSTILSWPQHRLQRATLPKGFNSEELKIN